MSEEIEAAETAIVDALTTIHGEVYDGAPGFVLKWAVVAEFLPENGEPEIIIHAPEGAKLWQVGALLYSAKLRYEQLLLESRLDPEREDD